VDVSGGGSHGSCRAPCTLEICLYRWRLV
jgi:hypothetical protein